MLFGKKNKSLDDYSVIERVPERSRQLTVKVFTSAGWLAGTLRIPPKVRIADHMEIANEFLPLTDVFMEAHSKEVDFFALKRDSIDFIIFEYQESRKAVEDRSNCDEHRVEFLTTFGRIRGKVYTRESLRLSDRMSADDSFVSVYDCRYEIRHPKDMDTDKGKEDFILLSTSEIIGFSEKPHT